MIFRTLASICVLLIGINYSSAAQELSLPERESPIPRTTNGVPHVQIGIEPDPLLSQMLLDRVAELPGVTLGPTRVSLPGATGFQLDAGMPLAHPEVIVGGREFAHLHPDGSLHASLDPALAKLAVLTGWAVSHPWAGIRDGWEGFVMIYTPTTKFEFDVVLGLVEQSYTYVTGQVIDG